MPMNPLTVIEDLEKYVDIYGIKLSKETRKTFQDIEEFSFKCNYPCRYPLFFSKSIRNSKELQRLLYTKNINPNLAALQLELAYYNSIGSETNYQKGTVLYSHIHSRENNINTDILDISLQYCVKNERNVLEICDIILAAMDSFEKHRKSSSELWEDVKLPSDNYTLCHVIGKYNSNLDLEFETVREYINNRAVQDKKFLLIKNIFN
ncbi:hypothetical protein [Clostridium thermarum]|uniref:hypothetical protein n=2 Tax=Clostridium thermarum TaxID=1716543 RepID=UPI001123CCEB|nr:hypothetical protein [Clostridium thermarum]